MTRPGRFSIFVLECVTCGKVDQRKAEDCTEQQYCDKCCSPMIVKTVFFNSKVFPRKL